MAIKTTYTCDRCGKQQDKDDQMWSLGIAYRHGANGVTYGANPSTHSQALWCRPCMVALGILGSHQVGPEIKVAPIPPPTLEDIVREMVREEVTALTGAA